MTSCAASRWIGKACISNPATEIGVKRRFRLTQSADFQRVRLNGKSFPHPLIVLVAAPNNLSTTRFGVIAGRGLGMAVKRNRAKRLIRAAIHELIPMVEPGWDMIIIARRPMNDSSYQKTLEALKLLLTRAQVLKIGHASTSVAE